MSEHISWYCRALGENIQDIWDDGGKHEKLDVGSFTVADCNDAFTAGPHDDN